MSALRVIGYAVLSFLLVFAACATTTVALTLLSGCATERAPDGRCWPSSTSACPYVGEWRREFQAANRAAFMTGDGCRYTMEWTPDRKTVNDLVNCCTLPAGRFCTEGSKVWRSR